jgi:uncharacterized protein (TIGR03067 family)
MSRYVVTVLVIGLLLGAAPAPEDKAKKDREALQGTWRWVLSEQGGKELGDDLRQHTLIFEKDTFAVKLGGRVIVGGKFKLDPSKKPKTIDMTVTDSPGDLDKGKEIHGIYELDKDTLKWCTSEPGGTDRPKEFSTKEGTRDLFVTLKKETK